MNTAAIAQHLNIAEKTIAKVEEWAHVLFVRFLSGRPQFVSKKVVEVKPEFDFEAELERREKESQANAAKAERIASEIMDSLPRWAADSTQYDKLFSAAIEIIEGKSEFDDVVHRFSSKKIIKK